MSKTENTASNAVVVSSVGRGNRLVGLARVFRKQWVWIPLMVVIIVVAALIGWRLWSDHKNQPPKLSSSALTLAVNKAVNGGDYSEAVKLIDRSASGKDRDLRLIGVYENAGNYKMALQFYGELIKQYGLTLGYADAAADDAMRAQDYHQAITYYEDAQRLALQEKNDPLAKANADYYATQIKKAQGLLK